MVTVLSEVDWYTLGTHLCVPDANLKAIKNENDSQRQLIEVLRYHQRNGEMSWEEIIEALKKIGCHGNLVISIESEYITTGNFSVPDDVQCSTQP